MKRIKLLTIVGFFLAVSGHCLSFAAPVSSELEKKEKSLPFIISFNQSPYRMNDALEEYKYLRKYYGVNEIFVFNHWVWDDNKLMVDYAKFGTRLKEMKEHGFFITGYQGGSDAAIAGILYGDKAREMLPFAADEKGNIPETNGILDKISPLYFSNYVKPMIDRFIDVNCEILRIGEYGLYHNAYSQTDIEQLRQDLMEQDEGIDWLFYDGHIEHLNFWTYAKAQLGIKKEDYQPEMVTKFMSYKEWLPVIIDKHIESGGIENYKRNWLLFESLKEYEYFKICQKWFKYAKEKGMKYCAWGPNGGVYRDMPHDPYVDYMEVRNTPPRFNMLPGSAGVTYFFDPKFDSIATFIKSNERDLRVTNEILGKPILFSVETLHTSRAPIGFYRDSFSSLLVQTTLAKPKFLMGEFQVSETVFDTGLSYSVRQFNLSALDAFRQLTEARLNKGRLLRSNWLIQTSPLDYKVFGTGTSPYDNYGDMRSELYLQQAYVPDIESCNGTDRIPLDEYKVITMGGRYYSEPVIDYFKEWLEKGKGRTLFTNYLYLGRSLYNGTIEGNRYVDLNIWKTSDIREYKIKEITWVDKNILPDVKIDKYSEEDIDLDKILELGKYSEYEAALPGSNIQGNLPVGAKVIMKGRTEGGEEVPLITIIPKGKNRIINIAFALKEVTYSNIKEYLKLSSNPMLDFCKNTMLNLFSYIQKEDNFFITRVKCSYPMEIVFRSPVLDDKGIVTVCAVGNGKPIEKDMISGPITLEYENHKVDSKIDRRSMIIASLDGSALASCSSIKIDNILYVKEVEPETLYVLSAIDNKSYNNSKLFHLWTHETTTIKFLKPKTWENEKEIKVYNFDGILPEEVGFKIKNGYIELKTKGGQEQIGLVGKGGGSEYKISYGKIEDSLWKEFCSRLAEKEELKGRFDDSGWRKVKLSDIPASAGTSWYRLHYKIPESWKGSSLVLELGKQAPHNSAITYFNGENQDSEDYSGWGYVSDSRRLIISKEIIKYGEDNVIAVRINNLVPHGSIYGGPIRLINPGNGETLDLSQLDWLYEEGGNRNYARY